MKKAIVVAAASMLAVAVTGCGDSDPKDETTSLSLKVAKGAVMGADCTVKDMASGAIFDTDPALVTTDVAGEVSFDLIGELSEDGVLYIECADGEYFNEATDEMEPMGDGVLSTAVPQIDIADGSATVAVTLFTTIAADQVKRVGASPIVAADANGEISGLFGLDDIAFTPPATLNSTMPEEIGAKLSVGAKELSEPEAYALQLGGITIAAAALDVSPFAYGKAISDDASDGEVDGRVNGVPVTITKANGETVVPYTSLAELDAQIDAGTLALAIKIAEATGSTTIVADVEALNEQPRDGSVIVSPPSGSGSGSGSG